MIINQALGKSEAASFKPTRIHFILYTSLSTIKATLINKKKLCTACMDPVISIHVSEGEFQVLQVSQI